MQRILSFRDLIAWQRAMELADRIYDLTEKFPSREWFGLAFQLRKSAVSIPSNIAEGHRLGTRSYAHHLKIALGSHAELDTQCEIATRRKFLSELHRRRLNKLLGEVGRLTYGLHHSVEASAQDETNP